MMTLSDSIPELLELPIGLDWAETWGIADTDLEGYDLTGCTFALEIREKTGATVITGAVELGDPGEVNLSLTAEQIADMEARVLHWALIQTDSLGKEEVIGFGPVVTREIS